jgi:hypothetical protein
MIRLEKDVIIDRRIDDVYSFILNFENESRWADEVVRTEKTSEGPIGVGSMFTDHVEFMGKTLKTSYEILAIEPKAITIRTSSGPVPFTATYSFENADGATHLSIGADVEPGGFFKLATPMIRRQLDRQWTRNFANLKALLES